MIKYLLQGMIFGIAYIAPIGAQNLYVINTAIQKSKLESVTAVFITIFFDISLSVSCFFGIGILVEKYQFLKLMILLFGSIVVVYIGVQSIERSKQTLEIKNTDEPLFKVIFSCFAVTWFNPQAIIDGSLLLGGFKASIPVNMSNYFLVGVCISSFLWFNMLSGLVRKFKNQFNKLINLINIVCGIILILYGLKLGYSFIKLL